MAVLTQPVLVLDRLRLCPFEPPDADALQAIASRREIADTTISVPHPYPPGYAVEWIAQTHQAFDQGSAAHYAVWETAANRLIGYAGLRDIDAEHRQAELSFWIMPEAQGHGYATQAAMALRDYAFAQRGLNRLCAYHMVRNQASERILQKIGMRREGCLRQRVIKWGQPEDVWIWAVLQSDLED